MNDVSSRGIVLTSDSSKLLHVSGDTIFSYPSLDLSNCDLQLRMLCCIATIGTNVSIDPVLDKSAPLFVGKFAAIAGERKPKYVHDVPAML